MEKIKLALKKFILGISKWIRENPKEFWILALILVVSAICRLYRIDHYMTFLGDEGRDVIVVRRLLTEGHPPLIGPGTSIGQMYLGPLYYYMMAPALFIANYSPIGPAVQIAILGIITVWFVWYAGREWFGKTAGLIAAALFAISPVVILYSRSSWNPNIMPFFALLSMYSVWKVWKENRFGWLIVFGFAFAAVLQSHYLGLLLGPTIAIFWILTLIKIRSDKNEKNKFLLKSLYSFIIFVLLMSPLFFFDLRHNWTNARAMYKFFTVRQETVSIKPWTAIPKIPEVLNLVDNSVVAAKDKTGAVVSSVLIILGLIMMLIRVNIVKRKIYLMKMDPVYWFLISWLGFGLIGFGLYKQNIYDHYFGFLFVVPFFLIGSFISRLLTKGIFLKCFGGALLVYLIAINIVASPLRKEPNSLLQRSEDVSHKIVSESGGTPMNLAVIADNNYEAGYQYFVELYGGHVLSIDAQDKSTVADQLFVVCELIPTTKCDPTHNPKAQVASFGWSKIDAQWELDGVIIYRLIHTQPQK